MRDTGTMCIVYLMEVAAVIILAMASLVFYKHVRDNGTKDVLFSKMKAEVTGDGGCEEFEVLNRTKKELSGRVVYSVASKERNLKFKVEALAGWDDKSKVSTEEYVSADYIDKVKSLYAADIEKELGSVEGYNSKDSSYMLGKASAEDIAAALSECNSIYSQELEYNSIAFLKSNPVKEVRILYESNGSLGEICSIPVDGLLYYGSILDKILDAAESLSESISIGERTQLAAA